MRCLACDVANGITVPLGGFVFEDSIWTVNHVMGSPAWRGWLVLQPRRHIEMLHEMNAAEQTGLPKILALLDQTLRDKLNARKVYVCLFAEALDCQHIHFHIIPHYEGMAVKGPRIFSLESSETPAIGEDEVNVLVGELKSYVETLAH